MKDWKAEFDKEFDLYNRIGSVYIQPDVLKNFIDSLLSQQRKEVLEKLPEERQPTEGYFNDIDSVRFNQGYNVCLQEIKSLINKQ